MTAARRGGRHPPGLRLSAELYSQARSGRRQTADPGRRGHSKQVEVTVAKVFALDAATEAHRCLEDGHPHGKVVLRVT